MFFDEYCKLCNSVGKPPTVCAVEMGFHKSEVTRWKQGTVPRRANLLRIADYFGCSIETLIGDEKREPDVRLSATKKMLIDLVQSCSEDDAAVALVLLKQLASRHTSQDDSR